MSNFVAEKYHEMFIEEFLDDEISSQELYNGIYDFLTSFNIRSGEFEANRFVIKKMDQKNILIFLEYVYPNPKSEIFQREIHASISIYKDNLVNTINAHAKKQGFVIKEE